MASLEQLTLRGIPAEGKNTNSHLQTVNHIDEKGGSFIIQKKYRLFLRNDEYLHLFYIYFINYRLHICHK